MRAWFTLPNLFTIARLLLVPVILWEITNCHAFAALALFAAAATTDVVDGYLARRLHVASPGGALLDPIADKLLLSGVFLALALAGDVPWWLVGAIFGRDILILLASAIALRFTKLRAFPPSVWGKASTFFQILTAVGFLGRNTFGWPVLVAFSSVIIWPTLALTVWSGVDYGWQGVRRLRMH
ncbi:MAG TPA: CDP-alcohol phosphatidyltransferase family protein [Bryobacteraceae bacterium]|nr:CDP-alcohol phosphatidyltransferase family protein [Bryobacteraceae bacterium]